jgi:ABC-type nitrate/sulfonate/bicarbonate transport system substrate-binding protein
MSAWVLTRTPFSLLIVAALAFAAPAAEAASTTYTPATPESGTDIPKVSVSFGMRPYADNTFYVVGMRKGWFKDVGITITPEPDGLKTTENQWVSLLLNRQVDINSATCSNLLPSYKSTDQLKCVGFAVTFSGSVMFANPKLGLKRLSDYMTPGTTLKEGLAEALKPLLGKTVYIPTSISEKEFTEVPFKLAGLDLPNYVTMEDSQMLLLAKSGRLDFMHPAGAPIAQTLLDAGWTPIYDSAQLLKFGPGGIDSPFESLVFNNGWAATADYVDGHKTTMMRFASVVFRIFDSLKKDPSLFGVFAPYLNSVAGTSLDADGVRRTVEHLDPFVPFDEQTKYFVDKEGAEYFGNSMGALIKSFEAAGALPAGITPEEVVWAAPMYDEMLEYKKKSDALFETADKADLSAEKKALVAKAHQFYDWDDFLDSYRLATAALAK